MNSEEGRDFSIAENIRRVRNAIKAACERSGRNPEEITLIAVSKMKPYSDIIKACTSGVTHFGENYVQELMKKIERIDKIDEAIQIKWHMVGHLQKNKVKYLIGHTTLIHSVDSVSLAEQIEKEATKKDQIVRILLEVNIAQEESKWGFDVDDVLEAAQVISAFSHVRVLGLMTSAPVTENPETNRAYFRNLSTLAQELASKHLLALPDPKYHRPVLSMGMTGDYEVAIEEGATMVRIGTAIFGKRDYRDGGIEA